MKTCLIKTLSIHVYVLEIGQRLVSRYRATNCSFSKKYLSYKYNIGTHVWNLPLCKLYECFDLYLSHNSAANPDGVFIRELCLLRDDYSLIDNNDITKEEVSHIIRHLYIS